MSLVKVEESGESIVLYFGGEFNRINAYTLASVLTNIADAAKAANSAINPGYEIEVVVEALISGSFKAKIRSLYRGAANLFSSETAKAIILGVVSNFIYQHTIAPDSNLVINVTEAEVVIQHEDKTVVIPRIIHDAIQKVEKSPQFRKGVGQAIRAIEEDPEIESIGFTRDVYDRQPDILIPRDRLANLPTFLNDTDGGSRELVEITDVKILRAILERSRRRWEFVWNGMKISAPVTDERFYDDFFAHKITIAPGDSLRVSLKIWQKRTPDVGIYINHTYEVIEVINHIPRPTQSALNLY
ncbi:MAG: hypothetical protein ED859_18480 [Desulfuromonadales bacterium]|nr:MAG: hypothetical protein ED859_18480 [Desulfuromonadales bacterium]